MPALTLVLAMAAFVNPFAMPVSFAAGTGDAILPFVEPPQDDLLLVALQLDQHILSRDLDGYMHGDSILLPIGELCRLLEMGVTVDPASGTASGTLASAKHYLEVDLRRNTAVVDGKPVPFEPEMVQLHRNDVYVDARLLSQWLPVNLEFSQRDAMVRVRPREPLQIQMRAERQNKAARATASMGLQDNGYELVSNPYRAFGFSAVDQRLTLSLSPSSNRSSTAVYSTLAAGELFGMGAVGAIFNNGGSPITRLTLSRVDLDASLLGGLRARSFVLGDVYCPVQPLLLRSRPGRGLIISSYPINQQDHFDTHTFQGTILPGWDVELYRDDVLIDYRPASEDGRYEFRDVPLLFGLNTFKLVFYGPRGERREEERRFNVGRSLISPGHYYYRLALNGQDDSAGRFLFQNDYGLSRDLSIHTTLSALRLEDGIDRQYASIGFRSCLGGVFIQTDTAFQKSGGSAAELALQAMVGNVSVGLRHTRLRDFTSEIYLPHLDPLEFRTSLRFDGIRMPSRLHLSQMSLGIETERYASGVRITRLTDRISANIKGLRLSHYMDYETTDQPGLGQRSIATRTLVVSKRFRHTELRGEMRSGLSPGSKVNEVMLSVERFLRNGRILTAGIMHSAETGRTSVIASYNRNQGSCGLGYLARYDSGMGATAGINMFLGLGVEPRTGTIHTDASSMAQSGVVSLRTFLDANANGQVDADEKPLEGIKFAVNSHVRDARTNADGVALLTGLQANQPVDISVVESSLEDPLWISKKKGYRLLPRVGSAMLLDIPIVATGEVSGTVRLNDSGAVRECSGVKLELVDHTDNVVMTVRSEYDGFFVFSKVLPGKYTVRVAERQIGSSRWGAPSREIDIPAIGSYVDGLDFALSPSEMPAATTASQPVAHDDAPEVGGG